MPDIYLCEKMAGLQDYRLICTCIILDLTLPSMCTCEHHAHETKIELYTCHSVCMCMYSLLAFVVGPKVMRENCACVIVGARGETLGPRLYVHTQCMCLFFYPSYGRQGNTSTDRIDGNGET